MSMLFLLIALLPVASLAQPDWREHVMALPENPGPNVTVADIERVHAYASYASPFFAALTPGAYEQNRDLVRRMTVYLASVDLINRDPQIRAALGRAFLAVAGLRWYVPPVGLVLAPQNIRPRTEPEFTPAPPLEPRFALQAPDTSGAPFADRDLVNSLSDRYDSAAAKASSVWKSAGLLRQSLQSRGMALNPVTDTSLARMQLYLDLAAESIRSRNWTQAQERIDQANAETEKVSKSVGR